jgi:hypothetical protein
VDVCAVSTGRDSSGGKIGKVKSGIEERKEGGTEDGDGLGGSRCLRRRELIDFKRSGNHDGESGTQEGEYPGLDLMDFYLEGA